jgi:transposase
VQAVKAGKFEDRYENALVELLKTKKAQAQACRHADSYDKLAANYLAFVKLAAIRTWLRAS